MLSPFQLKPQLTQYSKHNYTWYNVCIRGIQKSLRFFADQSFIQNRIQKLQQLQQFLLSCRITLQQALGGDGGEIWRRCRFLSGFGLALGHQTPNHAQFCHVLVPSTVFSFATPMARLTTTQASSKAETIQSKQKLSQPPNITHVNRHMAFQLIRIG